MELITTYICKGKNIGIHENMFGGDMMSLVDDASASYAMQICDNPRVVTLKISELVFKKPVKVGNLIKIYGEVKNFGNTSLTLYIEVRKHNVYTGIQDIVIQTNFIFVRIDEEGNPVPIGDRVKNRYWERKQKYGRGLLTPDEIESEKVIKNQKLDNIVNYLTLYKSDINEHLSTLVKYGSECKHITEMGVRWITSTWAFLNSKPKKMISYDMNNPSEYYNDPYMDPKRGYNKLEEVIDIAKEINVDFEFKKANVLNIQIEETDLLFLDTWHTYDQVKQELKLHSNKVRKYIIFHDTVSYGVFGEDGSTGIMKAINEFLMENKDWIIIEEKLNNNGLLVIGRV